MRIKLKRKYFSMEKDGFYGVYYPNEKASSKAFLCMIGDSADNVMVRGAVKWLHNLDCHVLALAPAKTDCGYHSYPLECCEEAITFLKRKGIEKIGVTGGSTTGMIALAAASYFPDITLTLAFTPPDFIMEGFYQGKRDGCKEWPGEKESALTYRGQPLPYLPYAWRHPDYWQNMMKESRAGGDMIASRGLFDESERLHPIQEEEKIKVENIRGHVVFVGAKDDVLWDTCKYIRRMTQRLEERPRECSYEALLYAHGTHFVFPQGMMKKMMPVGVSLLVGLLFKAGRQHPKECKDTRVDIDRKIARILREW